MPAAAIPQTCQRPLERQGLSQLLAVRIQNPAIAQLADTQTQLGGNSSQLDIGQLHHGHNQTHCGQPWTDSQMALKQRCTSASIGCKIHDICDTCHGKRPSN